MAFPKLLQKLFQDSGAGSMLRTDIIPIDSALSDTSTNGVQNKIVKAAIQAVADVCYQVGDLRLYAGTDVPDGWFRCDGSTVENMQTNYPKLYAVLGTNVLPNSSGRCLQGTTLANSIGKTVSAGLPGISGWTRLRGGTVNSLLTDGLSSGAVSQKDYKWNGLHNAWSHVQYTDPLVTELSVDASKSSQIYGASSTVQPPALNLSVLIKHD